MTVSLVKILPEETPATTGPEQPEILRSGSPDTVEPDVIPQSIPETITVQDTDIATSTEHAGEESTGEQPSINPANIRSVITSYVESQHGILSRQYVEDCIRYRNRHGLQSDCPDNKSDEVGPIAEERKIADRIFESATSNADHERRRVRLAAYDKVLLAIMDEGGPAVEQAQTRLGLNREYQIYLGNNINAQLLHMSQTQFVNDYNPVFTARPYQFRCNKFPLPCKYRYTGFDPREMGNYVEREPAFRETTPLFMPRKE